MRGWLRPRPFIVAAAVALGLYLSSWIVWAFTAQPTISGDSIAELERIVRSAQPAGQNGWQLIEDARRRFGRVELELDKLSRPFAHASRTYYGILHDNSDEGVYEGEYDAAVAFAQHALSQLREADIITPLLQAGEADCFVGEWGFSYDPDDPLPLHVSLLMPQLAGDRHISGALRAEMHDALQADDTPRAIRAAEAGLILARAVGLQPTLIEFRLGAAARSQIYEQMRQRVLSGEMTIECARQFIELLDEDDISAALHTSMDGEASLVRDFVQFVFTDDGNGDGTMLISALHKHNISLAGAGVAPQSCPRLFNLAGLLFAGRKELLEHLEDRLQRLHALAERPYWQVRADLEALPFETSGWRLALCDVLLPNSANYIEHACRNRCEHNGMLLLCAVEGYRAEHGRLPRSLDELVPDWLESVPADPYSPDGFIYQVRDGASLSGEYSLYSVFENGKDEGGEHSVSPGRWGRDYVFTR